MQKALFIDRDGIFNELVPWGKDGELCAPRDWNEWRIYPEIEEIPSVKELGYLLVLVTNQPDVERGDTELSFVESVNAAYRAKYGLDAVYCCLYAANTHPMKKPNPGMFLQAAQDLQIDLSQSFHLGDTVRDVEAATRAGCKSILWDRPYNRELISNFRINSISQLHGVLSDRDNSK